MAGVSPSISLAGGCAGSSTRSATSTAGRRNGLMHQASGGTSSGVQVSGIRQRIRRLSTSSKEVGVSADITNPAEPPADRNTLFGFPINRVVAFLTPFTVIIAGKVGLWLFANVGVFNTFNISHEKISTAIVQIFAFAIP